MKQLQNNFTTPEQSKRLLELGMPVKSADCYSDGSTVIVLNGKTFQESYNEDLDLARLHLVEYPHYIPCWSVGRLMEIAHICSGSNLSYKEEAEELKKFKEVHKCETIIEAIIMCIEDAHSVGRMDFSKLED